MVGISSYLLVSFWFTRVQANKSAISALLFNRVGDMFLTIGLFALIFALGNIDYAVVFSIAPYLNENIVTVVGICFLIGAMAKSAQIGLHVWLPQAMEGQRNTIFNYNKSINGTLILKKFYSTVSNKRSRVPNQDLLDAMVGDLLADGSIGMGNYKKWPATNGRLEFTFSVSYLAYLKYLKFNVYSDICTLKEPTAWTRSPNILGNPDKAVTQYWFSSKRLPFISEIYKIWYIQQTEKEKGGSVTDRKIVPSNICSLLKPIGLAHWIMGDGYYAKGTVYLCTDNFSKEEVEHLIFVLQENLGLKATIQKRTRSTGIVCWRIGFSRLSLNRLKELVLPHFIPEMLYKLNL